MKTPLLIITAIFVISLSLYSADRKEASRVSPNGISLIRNFHSFEIVAPSYRDDKQQIRVILGNPLALKAYREKIRPFPDGAILVKLEWSIKKHPQFPVATLPDKFVQVEFMIKNKTKYKDTGGWGFARFIGDDYKPYGKDAGFASECINCHMPVSDNDFVFTGLAPVP